MVTKRTGPIHDEHIVRKPDMQHSFYHVHYKQTEGQWGDGKC